jgi:hypothetical protein
MSSKIITGNTALKAKTFNVVDENYSHKQNFNATEEK